jgi:hypothetical protein
MPCSSSARSRCPLSPRGSTVSSPKMARALTRIWSDPAQNLRQRFCRLPNSSFFLLPSYFSPPPRQRQSTGADESPSSFRYSAPPARLSKLGRSTFLDTTGEHTRLSPSCRPYEPEARVDFGVSPRWTSDLEDSPATLLFNLPFYRANDSLIMIGDLLRFVRVATLFARE